jgi:hypothetical protein
MATTQSAVQIAYEQTPRYENAPTVSPYAVSTAVRYMPITSFRMTPAPGLADRSDELRGVEGSVPQLLDSFTPAGDIAVRAYVNDLIWLLGLAGFQATVVAGAATADVWTITTTGIPTGGSFTAAVTPGGGTLVTTGPIPYNATAQQVADAIKAACDASGQTSVRVFASGGPLPTGVLVTLAGSASGRATTIALGVNNLTGGTTPAPAFTHTTTGANGGSAALPDGGYPTTGTNVWTFAKRTGLNAKSAQILAAYVNEQVFLQGQGMVLSALNGNAAGQITGTLQGLVVKRVNDPNLAPSFDTQAIPHLREGDMFLTWLTGGGIVSDFTWAIANPVEMIRSLGVASYYPDTMYQGPGRVAVTGTIPKRALSATDWDALVAAGTFAAVATWHSPKQIGTSGYGYSMFMQMPSAQYVGGDPDPLTNARRFGASYNWFAAYDETAGYDVQFVLVTSLAATAVASAGVGL